MPSCFDVYAISNRRDPNSIEMFLNEFLPLREESADQYEFPQYSETSEATYTDAQSLIAKCCVQKTSEHGLYWRSLNDENPAHAMIFFLRDGHVIYGVSMKDHNLEFARETLYKMKLKLGSKIGYIDWEAPPTASDLEEFKELAIRHSELTGT